MSLKTLFLEAPEEQLDPRIKETVKEWDQTPRAIQLLKTLDMIIHGGGGSVFAVNILNHMLTAAILDEKTSYEAVVEKAYWRNA